VSIYLRTSDWLGTLEQEYLRDYIPHGGAAVKFAVVPSPSVAKEATIELQRLAMLGGFQFAFVNSSETRLHMVDQLFFAVARQVDWDGLARQFVRQLLERNGYHIPDDAKRFTFRDIAEFNDDDESELRRAMRNLLRRHVYVDYDMAQEFRIAMLRLCQAQLEQAEVDRYEREAVRDWLRGDLRLISALKPLRIFQKIARHNARDMFVSLTHWLRVVGKHGLVVTLEISRYTTDRRPNDGSLPYSPMAAMDLYEVLRQFIDATDELEGCLLVVLAPTAFLEDGKRGLTRYDPLRMRIADDVRDRNRANPLSSLIRLEAATA
jgi:hypothetical protein